MSQPGWHIGYRVLVAPSAIVFAISPSRTGIFTEADPPLPTAEGGTRCPQRVEKRVLISRFDLVTLQPYFVSHD